MNNRKTMSAVFEKIENGKKVNLESQEVELATQKQLFKFTDKIINGQKKIDKGRQELDAIMPQAQKAVEEIEQQAKELGVNPSEVKGYKSLSIEIQNTKSLYL